MPVAHLTDRVVLAVEGEGARPFLDNLLTQQVETLAPGEARFAALLTPQGRMLHDMLLVGTETGVLIDVAAAGGEDLLRRLTMYKLRAKITLTRTDLQVWAAWDEPLEGGFPDPRAPGLGSRMLTASPPRAPTATLADYDAHRIAHGLPDAHADGLHDRVYPLEADYDLLGAIDFKKGCFIGQETTSRMHRRGTLKTRLLPLAFDGPPPPVGAEVLADDRRAGELLSGVDGRALALLRLDRIGGTLAVDGRPVRVDPPGWFPATALVAAAG